MRESPGLNGPSAKQRRMAPVWRKTGDLARVVPSLSRATRAAAALAVYTGSRMTPARAPKRRVASSPSGVAIPYPAPTKSSVTNTPSATVRTLFASAESGPGVLQSRGPADNGSEPSSSSRTALRASPVAVSPIQAAGSSALTATSRARQSRIAHPRISPPSVPEDDEVKIQGGALPLPIWSRISITACTYPSAPLAVEAPIGTTSAFPPAPAIRFASSSMAAPRSPRSPTVTIRAPSSRCSRAFPRSGSPVAVHASGHPSPPSAAAAFTRQ